MMKTLTVRRPAAALAVSAAILASLATVAPANAATAEQIEAAKEVAKAKIIVKQFEVSALTGAWPPLQKPQIIAELRERIDNPFKVNQGSQPFCGPAAVVFELARKQPVKYAKICRSLFETGRFQGASKEFGPSAALRNSLPPTNMAQVDWMLMGTLRDTANLLFDVDSSVPPIITNVAGISYPWDLEGWAKELLGCTNVKFSLALTGDLQLMREARNVVQDGGVAFPLIDTALIAGPNPLVSIPKHWVTLLDGARVQDGRLLYTQTLIGMVPTGWQEGSVQASVYSWGSTYSINTGEGRFNNLFWGVVPGKLN
jgi:hypothetical protein